MRKILIYKNNSRHVIDERSAIYPPNPEKEIVLKDINDDDFERVKKNPFDNKLTKRFKIANISTSDNRADNSDKKAR